MDERSTRLAKPFESVRGAWRNCDRQGDSIRVLEVHDRASLHLDHARVCNAVLVQPPRPGVFLLAAGDRKAEVIEPGSKRRERVVGAAGGVVEAEEEARAGHPHDDRRAVAPGLSEEFLEAQHVRVPGDAALEVSYGQTGMAKPGDS